MKVLGSIEWRAFSSGCREVVRLQTDRHTDVFITLFRRRYRGRSSEWMRYYCLTSFFPIVDTCLSCEDIAPQSRAMVPR